jgi:hypothetical protein
LLQIEGKSLSPAAQTDAMVANFCFKYIDLPISADLSTGRCAADPHAARRPRKSRTIAENRSHEFLSIS